MPTAISYLEKKDSPIEMLDYYEFLQISPNADSDTIHRVYRFLAARLHPDNPESGDAEMFHLLKTAYDVLSDPERRSQYDAARRLEPHQPIPLSSSIDFMNTLDGELNRRLAVLAVLYYRRRTSPHLPQVPLHEIEQRMGFPRDYLDFTTWYLVKKGYVTKADNAEFTLTAEGVDFVEMQRTNLPVLNKLLTDGSGSIAPNVSQAPRRETGQAIPTGPIVPPAPTRYAADRRSGNGNGHGVSMSCYPSETDACVSTLDRRVSTEERRSNRRGRRSTD